MRDLRHIEEAAMNAWPAVQQVLYDGWVLRFAGGYTKRANSVNPLYSSTLDLNGKIEYCEEVFSDQGLPPIFRLIEPFVPLGLDAALEGRGYQKIDPTRVMSLNLQEWQPTQIQGGSLLELPLISWLDLFANFSGYSLEKHPLHQKILELIPSTTLWLSAEISRQPAACGLGVLQSQLFGLFDIVTHPDFRRQGWGTQLVAGMLNWACARGAKWAYLQVMESNAPAIGLYTKLGFQDVYGYWYRVPSNQ